MTDTNGNNQPEAPEDRAAIHKRLRPHLTERERRIEFHKNEAIIERFRKAGLEAGAALATIRFQRLYRDEYPGMKFPEYCRARWGFDGSRARQLIGASRANGIVTTETGIPALNEAQLRPMLRLLKTGSDDRTREIALAV